MLSTTAVVGKRLVRSHANPAERAREVSSTDTAAAPIESTMIHTESARLPGDVGWRWRMWKSRYFVEGIESDIHSCTMFPGKALEPTEGPLPSKDTTICENSGRANQGCTGTLLILDLNMDSPGTLIANLTTYLEGHRTSLRTPVEQWESTNTNRNGALDQPTNVNRPVSKFQW